jgi:hypothetical protein
MPEIVVKAEREAKSGICVLTVDLGTGRFEERSYRGIYGGLSWAGMGHPAFYILIGEPSINENRTRFEGKPIERGKLQIFVERSVDSPFLTELAALLTEDCNRVGARDIFAEIEMGDDQNFRDERAVLFREWLRKAGCRASLQRAPFVSGTTGEARSEGLRLSLSIAHLWLKENRIELSQESLAWQQLMTLTKMDLYDHKSEPLIYAARALGHAVSAFEKNNPAGMAGRYTPSRPHTLKRR